MIKPLHLSEASIFQRAHRKQFSFFYFLKGEEVKTFKWEQFQLKAFYSQLYITVLFKDHFHICHLPFLPTSLPFFTVCSGRCSLISCSDVAKRATRTSALLTGQVYVLESSSLNCTPTLPRHQIDFHRLPITLEMGLRDSE